MYKLEMAALEEKYRFLSIKGLTKVDQGLRSEIYAISEDRVVKAFHSDFTMEMVEKCYKKSQAYIDYGLPAQKPYEIVKTENGYGIIYDYIHGQGLGKYLHEHPERIETLAVRFADILREIHQVEVKSGSTFPDCKENFKKNLDTLTAHFSKYDIRVMKELLDAMPSGRSLLHGDWHAQNVMLDEQDVLKIIDTDDSTFGHPILDIGSFQLVVFTVDSHPENAMIIHKMDPEEVKKLWDCFLPAYFQTNDKAYLEKIQKACYYFGQLRMAQMLNNNVSLKPGEQKILVWFVRFNVIFKKKKILKLFSEIKFPQSGIKASKK